MPSDLLLARQDNGKYDYVRTDTGDLQRTDSADPASIRLLIQGEWIGDDGERDGPSLPDVKLWTTETDQLLTQIVERRLSVLIQQGRLVSAAYLGSVFLDGRLHIRVSTQAPGRSPVETQIPLQP